MVVSVIDFEAVRRRRVEESEEQYPDTNDVLFAAQSEDRKPRYVLCSDYIDSILVLRDHKNFTWKEIADWLEGVGAPFSIASITSAYRNYRREQLEQETQNGRFVTVDVAALKTVLGLSEAA